MTNKKDLTPMRSIEEFSRLTEYVSRKAAKGAKKKITHKIISDILLSD